MQSTHKKSTDKRQKIIEVALILLKTQGDYGLTMRKVASNSGVSLSNVQYYFKNKNDLLKAMADKYFNDCLEQLRGIELVDSNTSANKKNDIDEEKIREFIKPLLTHGWETSEMCQIFREYWAISTRNTDIEAYIEQYYQKMSAIIMDRFSLVSQSNFGLPVAVSLLISFVEGYSITAKSMPTDFDKIVDVLTSIIINILRDKQPPRLF